MLFYVEGYVLCLLVYSKKIWGEKKRNQSMKNCASLKPKVNRRKRCSTIHFLTGTTRAQLSFFYLHIYFKFNIFD